MSRRPLAARFDDFDEADARRQAAYLDAQAATPFWRERKRASYALLGLRPGMAVLDVGCGAGDDVRAMAQEVAPGGHAVGIDGSTAMVAEAARRSSDGDSVAFRVADAAKMPFDDSAFDAVRAERVLQHVADPAAVVAEMARVARPGAVVVAIEPDWPTLVIDGEPAGVGRAVARRWAAAIRQPDVGGRLPALFEDAGLVDVEHRRDRSVIEDLAFAEEQFAIGELAADATRDGEVTAQEADDWLAGLRARNAGGRFRAHVAYVTARGVAR